MRLKQKLICVQHQTQEIGCTSDVHRAKSLDQANLNDSANVFLKRATAQNSIILSTCHEGHFTTLSMWKTFPVVSQNCGFSFSGIGKKI